VSKRQLPTVQAREAANLPVDLNTKKDYLALIQEAADSRSGGGVNLTLVLYNEDGTKVQHQNGDEEVVLKWQYMPLSGPQFTSWTRAIFPEADKFTSPVDWDNEDMLERFVYVSLKIREEKDEQKAARFGPTLQVERMWAVPEGDRERIRQISLKYLNHEPPRLVEPAAPAGQTAAPQQSTAKAANPAPAAAQKPATQQAPAKPASPPAAAKPAATVPPGVDPNNPFGI
jgi:pyruvate/2-oxoglutarate dehydrogenase complex dihydrolipoamide acyltransferase (E2) component